MINPAQHRRGFSLTEFAIVLCVIGTIMAVIWGYASNAYEDARRERAFEEVYTTVTNIRTAYSGRGALPLVAKATLIPQLINGGTSTTAANIGIVPQDMLRSPATGCTNAPALCADTPWGPQNNIVVGNDPNGTFQVCNYNIDPAANTTNACDGLGVTGQIFVISLRGLNLGACIQLVTKLSGPAGPPGLLDAVIQNSTYPTSGSIIYNRAAPLVAGTSGTLPVSPNDTSALCTPDKTNTIRFIYRLHVNQ